MKIPLKSKSPDPFITLTSLRAPIYRGVAISFIRTSAEIASANEVSLATTEEVIIASSSTTLQGRALLHEAKAAHYISKFQDSKL